MKYLIYLFITIIVSSCTFYQDINLDKIQTGITLAEFKAEVGNRQRYMMVINGLTTKSCRISVYEYGHNKILVSEDGKEFINKHFKESDWKLDRYRLYFRNDSLMHIQWGKLNKFEDADIITKLALEVPNDSLTIYLLKQRLNKIPMTNILPMNH